MAKRRRRKGATLSWRQMKRTYTKYRKWDAARRKENNRLARERKAAAKTIAAEKAAAAAERDRARQAKAAAKAKRLRDAERRAKAVSQARVRVVQAQITSPPPRPARTPGTRAPATQSHSSAAVPAARPCGAKTEDGTPCQRLGECGIHRPRNAPQVQTGGRGS